MERTACDARQAAPASQAKDGAHRQTLPSGPPARGVEAQHANYAQLRLGEKDRPLLA